MRISLFNKDNFLNSGDMLNKTDQLWNEGKTLCDECCKEKNIGKIKKKKKKKKRKEYRKNASGVGCCLCLRA